MKYQSFVVNSKGRNELKAFLTANHKRGDRLSAGNLLAWASEAEDRLASVGEAYIEIRSFDSLTGNTICYTISDDGLDEVWLDDGCDE